MATASDRSSNANQSNRTDFAHVGMVIADQAATQVASERRGGHSKASSDAPKASSENTHPAHLSQAPLEEEREEVDWEETEEPVIILQMPQMPPSPIDNQIVEVDPKKAVSEQISNANSVGPQSLPLPASPSARLPQIEASSQDSAAILLSLTPTSQMSSGAKVFHAAGEGDIMDTKFNRYLSAVSHDLLSRTQHRLPLRHSAVNLEILSRIKAKNQELRELDPKK